MLRIMIQADLTKRAYTKLFDALSNVMAAIKKDRSYQTLVLVLIIAFTIALIFNTILSYRWIITSSNYGSINLHNGNRRHIQERRQQNDALVGHTHNSSKRVIYAWDTSKVPLKYYQQNLTDFTGCEYSNCVLEYSDYPDDASYADVVIVDYQSERNLDMLNSFTRYASSSRFSTVWLLQGHESPAYSYNKWRGLFNEFDGAITYMRDSLVYRPYGKVYPLTSESRKHAEYPSHKTKGAFAYVSICEPIGYDRLGLMKELSKYIDVDIFGSCTGNIPCQMGDWSCEQKLHNQYRFYLSWENSLCKDYMTEKFWKPLHGDRYHIPVALGGLTLKEYIDLAPPNSFLHVYNFSSIEELGSYMRNLVNDPVALNRNLEWRNSHAVELGEKRPCKLCEIANFPAKFKSKRTNIANKFNSPSTCRTYA